MAEADEAALPEHEVQRRRRTGRRSGCRSPAPARSSTRSAACSASSNRPRRRESRTGGPQADRALRFAHLAVFAGDLRPAEQPEGPHDQHHRHDARTSGPAWTAGSYETPKTFSYRDKHRREKAPGSEPMPPITTTTKTSTRMLKSISRFGAAAWAVCSAPPSAGERAAEKEDAGEQPVLVDAERAHHLAILRSRRAPARPSGCGGTAATAQPARTGPSAIEHEVVVRHALAQDPHRAAQARRARAQQILAAPRSSARDPGPPASPRRSRPAGTARARDRSAAAADLDQRADQPDDERRQQDRAPEAQRCPRRTSHQRVADIGAQHVERRRARNSRSG